MAKKTRYRMAEGGLHERFMQSRAKVQFFGGGYGNGKTTACVVKALMMCKDYPGCNGLIARATYPRLNDTIRKEFLSWCPDSWIQRMPTKDDNTLYMKNGSIVNFRYVAQRGVGGDKEAKSNLLSATYDWMIFDQIEDPEVSHKDFMDLMGRLRGNTLYVGDDPTMPKTGPRWFLVTSNPTRNWVYRELVRPVHNYKKGLIEPNLLCEVDINGNPVLVDGKPTPIIELHEGSTLENRENVGDDYIKSMLSTYTGSMRQRFVYGEWGALSGLVYPQFDETVHVLTTESVERYLFEMRRSGYFPTWLESYDHGIAVPSCYLLSLVDDDGNVIVVDGFYEKETGIADAAVRIRDIRDKWQVGVAAAPVYADPAVFKRVGSGKGVGSTVAGLFREEGILMQQANNDIYAGIGKVQAYLSHHPRHEHPIYGSTRAPYLYFVDSVPWLINEITEYYWQRDTSDNITDKPTNKNDHAMDALKYLLTSRPKLAKFIGKPDEVPAYMQWNEIDRGNNRDKIARHR